MKDKNKTIAVIDGMGGKIGFEIAKRIISAVGQRIEVIVLGTNAIATSAMMKSGANRGATGENAIKTTLAHVDMVVGPLSIVIANSFMGEVTPVMAEAIASCEADKVLLPISSPYIKVIGASEAPLPHLMDEVIRTICDKLGLSKEGV